MRLPTSAKLSLVIGFRASRTDPQSVRPRIQHREFTGSDCVTHETITPVTIRKKT
jgi:hypothetical protein